MTHGWIYLTGFGAFEEVTENPSGALAERLAGSRVGGLELRTRVLPVSFARAPATIREDLAQRSRSPALLVGLGVMREEGFRLELRARRSLAARDRRDVDGCTPETSNAPGASGELTSGMGESLAPWLADRPGWRASQDAGAYVCERVYRQLLEEGQRRGVPAVFVHVPPLASLGLAHQEEELLAFLGAAVRLLPAE